jgi:tetratricopeptide (TPR) repeat protein
VEGTLALANLHFVLREYEEAKDAFVACVKKFPDDARGWYGLGRLLITMDESTEAVKALLLSLERSPVMPEAENNLRTLLQSSQQASILANLARTNAGLHAAARVLLGVWTKQFEGAYRYLPVALASHPRLHIVHYVAGIKARNEGKHDLAMDRLEECLRLRPDYPPVHRELGLVAAKLGDCRAGKIHLRIYLKTTPYLEGNEVIQKQLEKCS